MITIIKNKTASFDVDPQNGFTPKCPKELPVPEGHLIADELNKNAKKASFRVGSKDAHPAEPLWKATKETPQFTPVKGKHKDLDIHWTLHCVVGTYGFDFIDGLPKPSEYDFVVYKGMEVDMHPYGACYHDLGDTKSTGVIEALKANDIDTVIVGGLATDYCVATTAKQLKSAGFSVIVNLASCRGIDPTTITSAIEEMKAIDILVVETLDNIEVK